MSNKKTIAIIGAGGRGMRCYATFLQKHFKDVIEIIAVADPDAKRQKIFQNNFDISEEMVFDDWHDLLKDKKIADAVIIATQDSMHFEPFCEALKLGYHILLEKPMSNDLQECLVMEQMVQQYSEQEILIAHVLRYSPFFLKIKEIIQSEQIGKILSIQHNENIGYWHFAHSFVRGNWAAKATSGPLILTKSCHDLDILSWLVDSPIENISSMGKLSYFLSDNAPQGAAKFCYECKYKNTCNYSCYQIYRQHTHSAVNAYRNPEEVEEFLKTSSYGRCVYQSENDVVDTMVSTIEFTNGSYATFHLSAFSYEITRTLKIMGSAGELRAHMGKNEIEVLLYDGNSFVFSTDFDTGDHHGGGDLGIIQDFVSLITQNDGIRSTSVEASIGSHIAAFAAEASRLASGEPVKIDKFRLENQKNI